MIMAAVPPLPSQSTQPPRRVVRSTFVDEQSVASEERDGVTLETERLIDFD
jgi:hypothetical protein